MKTQALLAEDLLPISLASLPVTGPVGVDVYLRTRQREPALLFCAAHQPITRAHHTELARTATPKLFIRICDRAVLLAALGERLPELVEDATLPIVDRLNLVRELTREVLSAQFSSDNTDLLVENARYFGSAMASVLGSQQVELDELLSDLPRDASLATHATNVCLYVTLLARQLGWSGRDLARIAAGGLLHDLGNLEINPVILNQPARLGDSERKLVQQHPAFGLQRLIHRTDLCEGIMMMVYQHHERVNGSGYPVALLDREIHPWGRMCAIADVFAALTSDRPYRPALSKTTALAVLQRGSSTEFDAEMVACWLQMIRA